MVSAASLVASPAKSLRNSSIDAAYSGAKLMSPASKAAIDRSRNPPTACTLAVNPSAVQAWPVDLGEDGALAEVLGADDDRSGLGRGRDAAIRRRRRHPSPAGGAQEGERQETRPDDAVAVLSAWVSPFVVDAAGRRRRQDNRPATASMTSVGVERLRCSPAASVGMAVVEPALGPSPSVQISVTMARRATETPPMKIWSSFRWAKPVDHVPPQTARSRLRRRGWRWRPPATADDADAGHDHRQPPGAARPR